MSNLNFAMVLRLIDKVSAPARGATSALRRITAATEAAGRSGVAWSNQQIATAQAQRQALRGQAFGIAAVVAGAGAALRPAIRFERAMAGVAAVARADDEELARLTATARELGATTAWAASDAAEGMKFLAMAGFSTNETIAAMPGMLDLASAGAIDLGRASDIASDILTAFGMKAEDMGRLGDVLTNTFTSSNTDLSLLGETMKYVAPVAKGLGVSLEQAAAMTGKLGDAGIKGSQAGTSLRAMLQRLAALPKPAADAIGELGVQTADANGNLRDLPTVLAEIDAALKRYGSADRAKMISEIFGVEALSAAEVLLEQAGTGALQAYTETLRETGSAARVAARLNNNTAGSLKRLQSVAESAAIGIGTILLPQVRALIDAVIPAFAATEAWATAHPELIALAVKLAAGLLAVRLASIALRWTLLSLAIPILKIIRGASWMLVLLPRLALALTALLNPIRLVRGALIALRVAMLASGVGALLVGIAMAGIWIHNNWKGLQSFFTGFWQSFREALGPAAPMLDAIIERARQIRDWFAELLGPMEESQEQWLAWGQSAGEILGTTLGQIGEWTEANGSLLRTIARLYISLLGLRLALSALRIAGLIRPLRWTARLIPALTMAIFRGLALGSAGRLAVSGLLAALVWSTSKLIPVLTMATVRTLALGAAGTRLAVSGLFSALAWATSGLIPTLTPKDFKKHALGRGGKLLSATSLIAPVNWARILKFGGAVGVVASVLEPTPVADGTLAGQPDIGEEESNRQRMRQDSRYGGAFDKGLALDETTEARATWFKALLEAGPLPTGDHLATLEDKARDRRAALEGEAKDLKRLIAAIEAQIAALGDGPMAENLARPLKQSLALTQQELENVEAGIDNVEAELEQARLRASELATVLQQIGNLEARPQINTKSIEAALAKLREFRAAYRHATGPVPIVDGRPAYSSDDSPHGGRDRGGPVRRGMPYIVGERGREIFVPGIAGTILPARVMKAAMAASVIAAPVAASIPAAAEITENLQVRAATGGPAPLFSPSKPQVIRQGDNVTINNVIHVHAAHGMSARDVAREVRRELERRESDRRADLHDGIDY